MIDQIMNTEVGMLGMAGLILSIVAGIAIHGWVIRQMGKEDDE